MLKRISRFYSLLRDLWTVYFFLGLGRLSYNVKVLLPKFGLFRKYGYITCETEGLIYTMQTDMTGAVECMWLK